MTTYLVSRHPGTIDWIERQGISVDERVSHIDPRSLGEGDRVVGNLPVHLAAIVCSLGAEYYHLSMELPPRLRGVELDANTLEEVGARLERFQVERRQSR